MMLLSAYKDHGKGVDVYFTCTVNTMINVWIGNVFYRKTVNNGELTVVGQRELARIFLHT